jgi:hypothetical protein
MDPLLWAAVVITALIMLLPCAFRLGFEIGKQDAEAVAIDHAANRAFEFPRGAAAVGVRQRPQFFSGALRVHPAGRAEAWSKLVL